MRLTIDNLDGLGAVDYSVAIAADVPLKIERTLNEPTIASGLLEPCTLAVPVRRGRVVIAADNGTVMFTGYLGIEAVAIYAGVSTTGPVYRYAFSAISDEWLLDKQPLPYLGSGLSTPAGAVLRTLTQRALGGVFSTTGVVDSAAVGVFEPSAAASWSRNAGALANASYSAYRVLDGALTMQPAGAVTHLLDFDTGRDAAGGLLSIAALKTASVKELANDVTLSGAMEPAAYITETFLGDGTTAIFQLSEDLYRPAPSLRKLLTDGFNEAAIDTQIWTITDPGSHLNITSAGLTLTGGTGIDGQTTLTAIDPVELGGSLVIEAGSVAITPGSQGILLGLYDGPVNTTNCVAGYSVGAAGGNTVLTPLAMGTAVGSSFTVLPGHLYTLRIRVHCVEMQRVLQTYYASVDGVIEAFGGGIVPAPITLVFDLQDLGAASNTPATILYDGTAAGPIPGASASCTFTVANSISLHGSIGYCRITQTGSGWVTSTPPASSPETRLIGVAGEGVDCTLSATGKVTFFAGRIPVAGEFVTVAYRNAQRSVARLDDPASVAAEAAGGASGTARWLGKVLKPPARSSIDCESAALAVLSFATSRAAALAGTYDAVNLQQGTDVWPGDVLAFIQNGATTNAIVRRVRVERDASSPEALAYTIAFANDWAEGLGLTLSEAIASDALLPLTASPAPGAVLANLQQLTVTSASTTALQIDVGTNPPAGGGFEVRRRDWAFVPSTLQADNQDLVLRSPVRSFSIPRAAQVEQYFIRMYDASMPPLYSRLSSAVFTDLPVS
jgi:hypothetical protein